MINMTEEAKRKFLEKHKPKTPEEIVEQMRDSYEAKQKYSQDLADIEKNLVNFLGRLDPILDPGTNEPIAWMRQVTYYELTGMAPENIDELITESEDLTDEELMLKIAREQGEQDKDFLFELMAKLIAIPSYDKEKWKTISTPSFIRIFNVKLAEIFRTVMERIDFF